MAGTYCNNDASSPNALCIHGGIAERHRLDGPLLLRGLRATLSVRTISALPRPDTWPKLGMQKEAMMTIETMAFVLGAILIAASVFGGGFEIREIKLPHIGASGRIVAAVVGGAFVLLALAINLQWVRRGGSSASDITASTPATFPAPMLDGVRLDTCVEWGSRCGENAAMLWCRTHGFNKATDYPAENVGNAGIATKLIGTGVICRGTFCTAFVRITCE